MKSLTIKDTYPIQALVLDKSESRFADTDEIIAYLEEKIVSHPVATHIGTFDHYTHTKNLPDHNMNENIVDVKIIVFCFGKDLPIPQIAAVRPRSIAVVEEKDKFTITFMDAPNPQTHEAMANWVKGIRR
jgi:hypothetical protein